MLLAPSDNTKSHECYLMSLVQEAPLRQTQTRAASDVYLPWLQQVCMVHSPLTGSS